MKIALFWSIALGLIGSFGQSLFAQAYVYDLDGRLSAVSYLNGGGVTYGCDNTGNILLISTNLAAASSPVPLLQGAVAVETNLTSVVFEIPQALSTNYSVGGYYAANSVTNVFGGTGPGPSIWGVGPLQPGTAYTFYFFEHDLFNDLSGPIVAINVATLSVPILQDLSVLLPGWTSIVFQLQQPLSTNYSIGGYYVSKGVTNTFPGTGPGPWVWGVSPLQPDTAYAFYFYEHDLADDLNGAPVAINAVTVPRGYNQISVKLAGADTVALSFLGNPGANYALDRSFSLSPPAWVPQASNTAGADGSLSFTVS